MSAGTKADSEGTLVRPNQVNDQVKIILNYKVFVQDFCNYVIMHG